MFKFVFTVLAVALISGCDISAVEEAETPIAAASASKNPDDCGCKNIKATLRTTADFETFTATGTVSGDLKGTIQFTGDASSLTPISSETFPPLNPSTLSFTSELDFITKKGTITTRGVGVSEIGPLGVGTELHQIIAGTERYENATGTFYLAVKADETGANFIEHLTGQICFDRRSCE